MCIRDRARREVERATRNVWTGVLSHAGHAPLAIAEPYFRAACPSGFWQVGEPVRDVGSTCSGFNSVVEPGCKRWSHDRLRVPMVDMVVMVDYGERQKCDEYCCLGNKRDCSQPP